MSVPSSELGPLTPFSARECVSPRGPKWGERHSLAGEGVGGPDSTDWTRAWHSVVYAVCHIVLCKVPAIIIRSCSRNYAEGDGMGLLDLCQVRAGQEADLAFGLIGHA